MVDLEILVEMNEFTVETLQNLMNFYSQAVDFFVQNQSGSYLYFKNRIKHLLLKPKVVELINDEESRKSAQRSSIKKESKPSNANQTPASKIEQAPAKALKTRPSIEYYMKMDNFKMNTELSTAHHNKHVEKLVNTYASAHSQKEMTIRSSLMDQKNNLRKRLEERRTSSRVSNQEKSMVSMDRSRFDTSRRITEIQSDSRSQYSHPPSQTVPHRSNPRNLLANDEYNVYQQHQATPKKDESRRLLDTIYQRSQQDTS